MEPAGSWLVFIMKSKFIKPIDPAKTGGTTFIRAALVAELIGLGVSVVRRLGVRRFGNPFYVEVRAVNGFIAGKTATEVSR
jgi:hypothetical protein